MTKYRTCIRLTYEAILQCLHTVASLPKDADISSIVADPDTESLKITLRCPEEPGGLCSPSWDDVPEGAQIMEHTLDHEDILKRLHRSDLHSVMYMSK